LVDNQSSRGAPATPGDRTIPTVGAAAADAVVDRRLGAGPQRAYLFERPTTRAPGAGSTAFPKEERANDCCSAGLRCSARGAPPGSQDDVDRGTGPPGRPRSRWPPRRSAASSRKRLPGRLHQRQHTHPGQGAGRGAAPRSREGAVPRLLLRLPRARPPSASSRTPCSRSIWIGRTTPVRSPRSPGSYSCRPFAVSTACRVSRRCRQTWTVRTTTFHRPARTSRPR
jgi:hypothetical protein